MRAMTRWGAAVGVLGLLAAGGACRQVLGYEPATLEVCAPGATQACQGTGMQTCSEDGTGWGACMLPPQCTEANAATACDDKNACTVDTCSGGKCQHAVGAAGVACGSGGSCDANGTCLDGAIVWSKLYGDSGDATLTALAVDGQGNIFVGGTFSNTLTFGGTVLSAKYKFGDAFLAKLGPDGTAAWAQSFGSATQEVALEHLAVDGSGNVTFSGRLNASFDFGCGQLNVATTISSYVAQLDASGACLWGHAYDPVGGQLSVRALATDPESNDVIVTGSFNGSADFGGGQVSTIDATDSDIFVVRLHSGPSATGGGSTAWATRLGGASSGYRLPRGVAVRSDGVIVLVGQLAGDIGTLVSTAPAKGAGSDALYVTLDSMGSPFGLKSFGDGNDEQPNAVVIDAAGNALFAGYITGSADFGSGALSTAGAGDRNSFLAKFAPDFLVYAKEWGDSSIDGVSSISTDKDSNIILAGATVGTINFGGVDLANIGQGLLYLAKLTPSAKYVWSKGFGDSSTQFTSDPFSVVDPKTQDVVLGITYTGTLDLGNGKVAAMGQNFVVAKFSP